MRAIFNERDISLILSIPLSMPSVCNGWTWLDEKSGLYTVKSGYRILRSNGQLPVMEGDSDLCQDI